MKHFSNEQAQLVLLALKYYMKYRYNEKEKFVTIYDIPFEEFILRLNQKEKEFVLFNIDILKFEKYPKDIAIGNITSIRKLFGGLP